MPQPAGKWEPQGSPEMGLPGGETSLRHVLSSLSLFPVLRCRSPRPRKSDRSVHTVVSYSSFLPAIPIAPPRPGLSGTRTQRTGTCSNTTPNQLTTPRKLLLRMRHFTWLEYPASTPTSSTTPTPTTPTPTPTPMYLGTTPIPSNVLQYLCKKFLVSSRPGANGPIPEYVWKILELEYNTPVDTPVTTTAPDGVTVSSEGENAAGHSVF